MKHLLKQSVVSWSLAVALLLAQGLSSPLAATTLLEENFDSYATGTFPPGWTLVYDGTGPQYQVVTNQESVSAPNSFTMLGRLNWSAVAHYGLVAPPEQIEIDVMMRVGDGSAGSHPTAGIALWNKDEGSWGTYYVQIRFFENEIQLRSSFVSGVVLQSYDRNRWYQVRIVYDEIARTASVWIDGTQRAFDEPMGAGGLGYNGLVLTNEWGAVKGYFDDLLVYDLPGLAPLADYGDAPDSSGNFPTRYNTTNSRLGLPGAHHLTTQLEMLGVAVSSEVGVVDPADPDGVPNLVDMDGFDDGILELNLWPWWAVFGVPTCKVQAKVRVTIDAAAPDVTRYLNILFDSNEDLEWRNTIDVTEWMVRNLPLDIPPGMTVEFWVVLGFIPNSAIALIGPHAWLRATLSRTEVDENAFDTVQGWDGSGAFDYGETEDYINIPRTVRPMAWIVLECREEEEFMWHRGAGSIKVEAEIKGPDASKFTMQPFNATPPNQSWRNVLARFGWGYFWRPASTGLPPEILPIPPPDAPPKSVEFWFVPEKHDFFRHESDGIKFTFWAKGNPPLDTTTRIYAQKQCDMQICHHDPVELKAALLFGGLIRFVFGQPIPIVGGGGDGDTLAYAVFGENQETPGELRVVRSFDYPLGIPEGLRTGVLPINWIMGVDFEIDPEILPPDPMVNTEIIGLHLAGYTDQMLADAGIFDESSLRPFRVPLYVAEDADVYNDFTDVGSGYAVNTVDNIVEIYNPYGITVWGLVGISSTGDCCIGETMGNVDCEGIIDIGDVTTMIQNLFITLNPPCCEQEADIDQSGLVDIGDLTMLIASLFITLNPLDACP